MTFYMFVDDDLINDNAVKEGRGHLIHILELKRSEQINEIGIWNSWLRPEPQTTDLILYKYQFGLVSLIVNR